MVKSKRERPKGGFYPAADTKGGAAMEDKQRNIILLYEKYYRELLQYSFSLFDYKKEHLPDAEDCVQDTFEKALRNMRRLQEHPAPLLWLKRMCRNITMTRRRNIRNRARILGWPVPVEGQENLLGGRDGIAEWMCALENRDAKQVLLQVLTENEREVYRVYYEKELGIRETAGELGITEGSVRGCLQRIRQKAEKLRFT